MELVFGVEVALRSLMPLFWMASACQRPVTDPLAAVDPRCQGNTVEADVVALSVPITMNRLGSAVPDGLIFALSSDVDEEGALRDGVRPRPLVLRANARECLNVTLTNRTAEPVSLHVDGIEWRTGQADDGAASVAPGESMSYTLYAGSRGTHLMYSVASADHRMRGLFGALHIEPIGSVWYRAQVSAADLALATTGDQACLLYTSDAADE